MTEEAKLYLKIIAHGMERTPVNKYWYALYIRPRWEKKVTQQLTINGVEVYCPLNRVRKKWSDRFKIVEEPLFKSYVFVRIAEAEKSIIRYVEGVVNFVYWQGKPAVVNEEDIIRVKRFLNEHSDVKVESLDELKSGSQVLITAGVFMDHSARVLENRSKTVLIEIKSLGCNLIAQISRDQVEPL